MINIKMLIKSIYSPSSIYKTRFLSIGKAIIQVFILAFIFNVSLYLHSTIAVFDLLDSLEVHKESFSSVFVINEEIQAKESIVTNNTNVIVVRKENSLEMNEYADKDVLAFLNDKLYINAASKEIIIPYTMLGEGDIVETILQQQSLIYLGGLLIFTGSYLFQVTLFFFGVSLLAAISMYNKNRAKIPYRVTWRIAAFAITNTVLLFSLINLLQMALPPFISFLILLLSNLMVYLSFRK
ncbi:hypothetical protein CIB95_04865 [Lottiidibacillus patelloidae]|uniref:DUF1189 domain-containing protein n=1 Tax=Lottiidibacillus patelloidae TaxID=2670334 RepID=A0A263BVG6_9BACI|nr:DUF1189 family protein [Lottiidibacillus patelloidae]OZM57700.1 hypothetical protein CIB95_04865 [Lottiidibacillus patelloidae]